MMYVLAAIAIPLVWFAAIMAQRRLGMSRHRLGFDIVFAIVAGAIVAVREGAVEGLLTGLVVLPVLVLFSAGRTVQMRYIERKTQSILDSSPGMREAYDRRETPSRRQRKARRDGE